MKLSTVCMTLIGLLTNCNAYSVQLENFETSAEVAVVKEGVHILDGNSSPIDYSSSAVYFNPITNVVSSAAATILPIPITNARATMHTQTGFDPNRVEQKIYPYATAQIIRTSYLSVVNVNPSAGPVTLVADLFWNYLATSDTDPILPIGSTSFYFDKIPVMRRRYLESETGEQSFSFLVYPNKDVELSISSNVATYGLQAFADATMDISVQFHLAPNTPKEYSLILSPSILPVPEAFAWQLLLVGLTLVIPAIGRLGTHKDDYAPRRSVKHDSKQRDDSSTGLDG